MKNTTDINQLREFSPNYITPILRKALKTEVVIDKIEQIKIGKFNTIIKVTTIHQQTYIIRIGPDISKNIYSHELLLLKREYSIHPLFHKIANFTPQVIYSDFSKKEISRDYLVQKYINGRNGEQIIGSFNHTQKIHLWNQILSISNKINEVQATDFGFPSPGKSFTSWQLALYDILKKMILDLKKYNLPHTYPVQLLKVIKNSSHILDEITVPKLIHGDLWPKNILIEEEKNTIVGVLDIERAFWGDPKSEWILPGKYFASKKAQNGYEFRCGLFSADYAEIPSSVTANIEIKTENDIFRKDIYLGIYLTLRLLESERYPRKETWIEKEFKKLIFFQ